MANVLIDETILQGWADAIREKTGTEDKMLPSEMLETTEAELMGETEFLDRFVNKEIAEYHNDDLTRFHARYVFAGCTSLKSVSLPNLLRFYYSNCFSYCTALESVDLPKLEQTDGYDFYYCTSLTSISLPNLVEISSVGQTFYRCTALESVDLPKLESMSRETFYYCTALTSISLPNLVEITSQYNFNSCSSLTSVDLPKLETIAGSSNFWDCSSLTSISLPSLKKTYGYGLFRGCIALTSINLPSLVEITNGASYMFENCYELVNVVLSETEYIKDSISFAESSKLSDESVQNIINALATGAATKTLTLHADVKAKLTEEQLATIASKNWIVK